MKKLRKRYLAMLLSAAMFITAAAPAGAEEETVVGPSYAEELPAEQSNYVPEENFETAGSYVFRWSGGSGRVVINCTSVEERDGQTWATITFSGVSGRASHYDAVQVNGAVYTGSNTFTIPVTLNGNTVIQARTTAMSQAHWITYTLYIGKAGSGENGADESTLKKETEKLDQEAPAIAGLTFDSEIDTKNSDLLRIFRYKDTEGAVYTLLEVDLATRTARETAKPSAGTTAEQSDTEGEGGSGESGEEEESAAEAELMKQLYDNKVVKYLVLPEGTEAPAGLDKEVILVSRPVENVCAASPEALERMEEMGLSDKIAVLALDPETVGSEELRGRLEDGSLVSGGTADDLNFRALITQKADTIIVSSELFGDDSGRTLDEVMEDYRHLAARAVTLGIPLLMDRSADEKDEKGAAEWYKYYGVLFNKQDEAQKLFNSAVG